MWKKKKLAAHSSGSYYAGLEYEQAVRKYADTVTRICIMRCGNPEDAKDCFQNVFLKLYTSDKLFESEEHLKAWLIQVAIHQCADFHRQAWKQKVDLEDDVSRLVGDASEADKEADASEIILLVRSLPEKYRDVIYLYYYEEYSVAEIAQLLGSNENTVKSLLKRGRDKLREMIGGMEDEVVIRI